MSCCTVCAFILLLPWQHWYHSNCSSGTHTCTTSFTTSLSAWAAQETVRGINLKSFGKLAVLWSWNTWNDLYSATAVIAVFLMKQEMTAGRGLVSDPCIKQYPLASYLAKKISPAQGNLLLIKWLLIRKEGNISAFDLRSIGQFPHPTILTHGQLHHLINAALNN